MSTARVASSTVLQSSGLLLHMSPCVAIGQRQPTTARLKRIANICQEHASVVLGKVKGTAARKAAHGCVAVSVPAEPSTA